MLYVKLEWKEAKMVAYEFYLRDNGEKDFLIGILPERRRDFRRINEDSILKWGRMVLGNRGDNQNIYFVKVKLD